MPAPPTQEVEHEITVRAPADTVYRYLADVANWPALFPPTVHVEYLEQDGKQERIQIWATANGDAKTWTSRRILDPDQARIEFRQEKSTPPVASMGGTWLVEPVSEVESRVRLLHDYRAVDDDPAGLEWIEQAVDRNSRSELGALKSSAELATESAELVMTFEDTVRIAGSAKDAFDFINEAQLWTERLPHVVDVTLREDTPGVQVLAMDTTTKDGSVHTTESVRVAFPHHKIVYKQTTVPPLMDLHTGEWSLAEDADGVSVTSRHTVVINKDNIQKVLGEDADVAVARKFVREALGGNSTATLGHAKEYAERAR
ncbi:MAG TPA: aromatase/cyclase [Pseudonocardiaceae bacterium]|nr:aromatase/cyclase [Pseudonocardiaceae bacterium]